MFPLCTIISAHEEGKQCILQKFINWNERRKYWIYALHDLLSKNDDMFLQQSGLLKKFPNGIDHVEGAGNIQSHA